MYQGKTLFPFFHLSSMILVLHSFRKLSVICPLGFDLLDRTKNLHLPWYTEYFSNLVNRLKPMIFQNIYLCHFSLFLGASTRSAADTLIKEATSPTFHPMLFSFLKFKFLITCDGRIHSSLFLFFLLVYVFFPFCLSYTNYFVLCAAMSQGVS